MSAGHHLTVDGIWKSYGHDTFVVRDVSFTVEPGEFVTLLGPSGSGKTSTLMMIAGFETPTRGSIRVDGQDIAGKPPEQRNFGIVFQGYALFPHMNVLENVGFPLRMRGIATRDRRRRAAEMLEKVDLSAFAHRRPYELSGGQQQRVALARALVFDPNALLLDEPLGALDRKLREQLQLEIKEIQRRVGISILLVTHDQDEAMMLSDRIAVMSEGEIVQIGTPADLYLHPATAFVAGFLGETNFLPAVCRGLEGNLLTVELTSGAIAHARPPRNGATPPPGAPTLLAIRPERLRLLQPQETADSVIEATAISSVFLGRHARTTLSAEGQTLIISTTDWPTLPAGTTLRLGWSSDDAQCLAHSDHRRP